jgi:zinc/manganese transport system permease protein
MTDAISLLWPPFLVALCLIGIHSYFGIQVLTRNVIFVDLALAQIAALGTTVAFMLGHSMQAPSAYGYSLAFTLLAALLLAFTRGWSGRLSQEALIGVIYVVAAAAAILLIDRAPQGAEHLKQILTGNILTTGIDELYTIVPIYLAIGLLHSALRHRLVNFESASWLWEFFFYASFGIVVTSSVALAGVLLVFSFLIIPAAIGVLYESRFSRQLVVGWTVGTLASAAGLAASYAWDLPTGAAMVCAFGASLAIAGLLYPFLRRDAAHALRRAWSIVRWSVAVLLVGSAIGLVVAPRTDQPLLDSIEYLFPSLRHAYFSKGEIEIFQDADSYAERYRREAEQLNELEIRSRAEGTALDDMLVRRISSFLKSYGEMRKGEEFVKSEVRSRARERIRWFAGFGMILLALAVAPGISGRVRRLIRKGRPGGIMRSG